LQYVVANLVFGGYVLVFSFGLEFFLLWHGCVAGFCVLGEKESNKIQIMLLISSTILSS